MSNSTSTSMGSGGRAVAGLAYSTVGLVGLGGYGLLFTAMIKHGQAFAQHTFYTIVWSLALADVGFLLLTFAVAVPLTFSPGIFSSTTTLHALAASDTLFFFTLLFTSLLMAFDRFSSFLLPTVNKRLFSRPNVYATTAAAWLLGAAVLASTTAIGCLKIFDADRLQFTFACDGRRAGALVGIIFLTQAVPMIMAALYVALFVYLRRQKAANAVTQQNARRDKAEHSLAIQGAIICGVLWVSTAGFWLAPRLPNAPAVPVVAMVLAVVNSTINPYIYFGFNGLVRKKLAATLGCQQKEGVPKVAPCLHRSMKANRIAPAVALEIE